MEYFSNLLVVLLDFLRCDEGAPDCVESARGHRKAAQPGRDKERRDQRIARCFAADRDRHRCVGGDAGAQRQHRRVPSIAQEGKLRIFPVGGESVLGKIIGSDRDEISGSKGFDR